MSTETSKPPMLARRVFVETVESDIAYPKPIEFLATEGYCLSVRVDGPFEEPRVLEALGAGRFLKFVGMVQEQEQEKEEDEDLGEFCKVEAAEAGESLRAQIARINGGGSQFWNKMIAALTGLGLLLPIVMTVVPEKVFEKVGAIPGVVGGWFRSSESETQSALEIQRRELFIQSLSAINAGLDAALQEQRRIAAGKYTNNTFVTPNTVEQQYAGAAKVFVFTAAEFDGNATTLRNLKAFTNWNGRFYLDGAGRP